MTKLHNQKTSNSKKNPKSLKILHLNPNPYTHAVQVQTTIFTMCRLVPDFATSLGSLLGLAIAKRPWWGDGSPNPHV